MKYNPENIEFLHDKGMKQSELIYDGAILQLYRNEIELANGSIVQRELINHQAATAILATTNRDTVLLVKQYRPAIVRDFLELPAGLIDTLDNGETEDELLAAKRELEEETGYQANKWERLGSYYLSPGFLNEKITLYHAQNLHKVRNPLPQDEDEFVSVHEFTQSEIISMLHQEDIQDLKTIYALQYWLNKKGNHHV